MVPLATKPRQHTDGPAVGRISGAASSCDWMTEGRALEAAGCRVSQMMSCLSSPTLPNMYSCLWCHATSCGKSNILSRRCNREPSG